MLNSLLFNLEPTFRCNLGCEMCPRFSSRDAYLDMQPETYQRIADAMRYAHTVDYTGWGEPMLHKGIYNMIRAAKVRDCQTTMTSNGTIFTEANARSLIEAGLDKLTVSIDGMRPETYDVIRIGASLEKVAENLRRLSRLIEKNGSGPELGIAFTVQETNADDLPLVVKWVRSVGAKVLHLKHINVISTSEDWERSFLKYRLDTPHQGNGRLAAVEGLMNAAAEEARDAGLLVLVHSEIPLTSDMNPGYCLAAPLDAVYFSYQGRVAPCCHFGHHVSRFFEGTFHPPSALFFGDIRESSFEEIWESQDFHGFRRGFETREFPKACRSCYLLYGK